MIPDQRTPVVLNAMTLRGVGSYLMGSRLEFKPLTIICGTNGSGKSTWLKALNVLASSLAKDRLPYGFTVSDWDPNCIDFTNAFYHLGSTADASTMANFESDVQFGPPGTIGLDLLLTKDTQFGSQSEPSDEAKAREWNYLWTGAIQSNTRVRIRIAHPTHWSDTEPTPHLEHFIELAFNEEHIIRVRGERDPLQKFEDGFRYPRRSKPYVLEASRSLVTGNNEQSKEIVPIATIHDLNSDLLSAQDDDISIAIAKKLLRMLEDRIREILKQALDGYFYIGAIRDLHTSTQLTENAFPIDWERTRYVGASGEFTWLRETAFEYMPMTLSSDIPLSFEPEDIQVNAFLRQFSSKNRDCTGYMPALTTMESGEYKFDYLGLESIWGAADPSLRTEVLHLQMLAELDENELPEGAALTCAAFLNSAIQSESLFEEAALYTRTVIDEGYGEPNAEVTIDDAELDWYSDIDPVELTGRQLRERNCAFVLYFLAISGSGVDPSRWRCTLNDYLNRWLSVLCGVRLEPRHAVDPQMRVRQWTFHGKNALRAASVPSSPFLLKPLAVNYDSTGKTTRLIFPTFGMGEFGTVQPPRQLSAGFHQVFPIVVQLGLMRHGELIAVENPEAHLHPALQIKITEMLIAHANSGRHVFVETHSDLVVRRTMRALLSEELPQASVHIYFSELIDTARCDAFDTDEFPVEFHGSKISLLEIDESGRIVNWPADFLDEDMRESQRLMDIMYGKSTGANDDDE